MYAASGPPIPTHLETQVRFVQDSHHRWVLQGPNDREDLVKSSLGTTVISLVLTCSGSIAFTNQLIMKNTQVTKIPRRSYTHRLQIKCGGQSLISSEKEILWQHLPWYECTKPSFIG